MKIAQGEKLIKKWESKDTSGCGKAEITVTNRRIITERTYKTGEQTDVIGQEVLLESVKGVSCTNAKKANNDMNWWHFAAIILAGILLLISLVFNGVNCAMPEDDKVPEDIMNPLSTIFWIGMAIAAVLFVIGLFNGKNKTEQVAYRVIIYTAASCTLNAVGNLSIGATVAPTDGMKVFIPVTYEVAKEISETIGAYTVMAKYGVSATEKKTQELPQTTVEEKAGA